MAPRVFYNGVVKEGEELQLDKEQAHHLFSVLRLKEGAAVELVSKETLYPSIVVSSIAATLKIGLASTASAATSRVHTVFFALTKGDHNDLVIEKCTELGVSAIYLWQAERSVVKFDPSKFVSKIERFGKIARSAAEQSKRLTTPTIFIGEMQSICDRYGTTKQPRPLIALSLESGATPIRNLQLTAPLCDLIIGPEGDLSPKEYEKLDQIGVTKVSLGAIILRAETAAIAGVASINAIFGMR